MRVWLEIVTDANPLPALACGSDGSLGGHTHNVFLLGMRVSGGILPSD